jgi:hypothetical protein
LRRLGKPVGEILGKTSRLVIKNLKVRFIMKRLFALFLALAMIFALTACGGEDTSIAPRDRSRAPGNDSPADPVSGPESLDPPAPDSPAPPSVPVTPDVPTASVGSDPFEFTDYVIIGGRHYTKTITDLSLIDEGLTDDDILPLRHLTNLTYLDLDSNDITDLSPLAGLTNLEVLDLRHNRIRDITPLAGLINLEYLILWDNVITDISPLAGFTGLRWLNLSNNPIDLTTLDISTLTGLQIHGISLSNCGISDLSPLSNLESIGHLHLDGNNITDLTPLAGLSVARLYLNNNQITDLTGFETIDVSWLLDLSDNQITDLTPLYNLPDLHYYDGDGVLLLNNNPLSQVQIDGIKAALPRTKIYYDKPNTTSPVITIMPPFTPAIAEGNPTIGDALEVLKYLAGLPNEVNNGVVSPTIGDALEVLKFLAKLPSVFDNPVSAIPNR